MPPNPPQPDLKRTLLRAGFAALLINFLANFVFMGGFGFYEDDYIFTIPIFKWHWSEYGQNIWNALRTWPLGRPGYWFAQDSAAFLLSRLNSLNALGAYSFATTSAAALCIFLTLRRLFKDGPAFLAAVFYLLYPADTGKQIFMHQANFALPLAVSLIAINCSISRRHLPCFFFAGLTLLIYEPYFLLIAFSPFLIAELNLRSRLKLFFRYLLVLPIVLFCVLSIRKHLGDGRAADVEGHLSSYLGKASLAMLIGPVTAAKLCIVRALDAAREGAPWQWVIAVAVALAAYHTFKSLHSRSVFHRSSDNAPTTRTTPTFACALTTGLAMFVATYAYRFYPDYYPPIVNIGRLSALHAPGVPGLCIALCAVLTWFEERSSVGGQWSALVMSLYFGLLASFGTEIQLSQYVVDWGKQRAFFTDILRQYPDLRDGDKVLVNIETGFDYTLNFDSRPQTEGFPPFWMVNYPIHILEMFYDFPSTWHSPPKIYGLWSGAILADKASGIEIETPPYYSEGSWPIIGKDNLVYFRWDGRVLTRQSKPFAIGAHLLTPRPIAATPTPETVRRSPFSDLIFNQTLNNPLWPSLIDSVNYPR